MHVFADMLSILSMDETWRDRLFAAIESDGRSARQLSKDAGLGDNFITQLLKTGRAPSIDNFIKLSRTLNVSEVYILTGSPLSADDEQMLRLSAGLDPDLRKDLVEFVEKMQARSQK